MLLGCPIALVPNLTDPPTDTGEPTDTGTPTDPDTDVPTPASCGPGFVSVGSAGATTTESFGFTYGWDGASGISVGTLLELELPPDLVSFAVTVDVPGANTGLDLLEVDGETWIDGALYEGQGAWDTAPYYHWAVSGGTVVAPITPSTDPSGARCLRVQAAALTDLSGTSGTLWLTTRSGETPAPVLDLNVVVVGATDISSADLQTALATTSSIWTAGGGPAVGSVVEYSLTGDTFLDYDDSTSLRASAIDPTRTRAMNLFFVQDYLNPDGTLGEAGGIPGPVGLQQVDEAGVILSVDAHLAFDGGVDTALLGSTIAHEVGHQLGLFHTTESDGTRLESLDDTPACPASADLDDDGYFSAAECQAHDGPNFMFWAAGSYVQETVSADQGWVLRQAPVAY